MSCGVDPVLWLSVSVSEEDDEPEELCCVDGLADESVASSGTMSSGSMSRHNGSISSGMLSARSSFVGVRHTQEPHPPPKQVTNKQQNLVENKQNKLQRHNKTWLKQTDQLRRLHHEGTDHFF